MPGTHWLGLQVPSIAALAELVLSLIPAVAQDEGTRMLVFEQNFWMAW